MRKQRHHTKTTIPNWYSEPSTIMVISRADIARPHLTRPTVSSIVRDLLDEQLVLKWVLGHRPAGTADHAGI